MTANRHTCLIKKRISVFICAFRGRNASQTYGMRYTKLTWTTANTRNIENINEGHCGTRTGAAHEVGRVPVPLPPADTRTTGLFCRTKPHLAYHLHIGRTAMALAYFLVKLLEVKTKVISLHCGLPLD